MMLMKAVELKHVILFFVLIPAGLFRLLWVSGASKEYSILEWLLFHHHVAPICGSV